jgi:alkylation response protein AidB-like acyl-CoA dehydrogenase
MPVDRETRDDTTAALFGLAREIADAELRPRVAEAERDSRFPRAEFATLGRAGLLGLPYPEDQGGGGQPYETYLQVVEELATAWLAVGLGVSVHTLTCYPIATAGTAEQREQWLPDMLGGDQLGAYCLSEPGSGSDAAALATRAVADGDEFVIDDVQLQHNGKDDTMEDDIILPDKMHQLRIRIIPIGFPVLPGIDSPLPGSGDISNRRIEPYV